MAKAKTAYTGQDIADFIKAFVDNEKKYRQFQLIDLLQKWPGSEPKMLGPGIIG